MSLNYLVIFCFQVVTCILTVVDDTKLLTKVWLALSFCISCVRNSGFHPIHQGTFWLILVDCLGILSSS